MRRGDEILPEAEGLFPSKGGAQGASFVESPRERPEHTGISNQVVS